MLGLRFTPAIFTKQWEAVQFCSTNKNVVVCAAKGPRPRYPRVWKTRRKIGTISKSLKLIECIKGLSNVKEEVYGALDSFIAWELEFPLITVKKALKTLEKEMEWKRIIQVTKWMLSKGQGRTMGSYYTLLNALAEDGRIDEAEELWTKLFAENLESMPRIFFEKMISIYYRREMHEKMFETVQVYTPDKLVQLLNLHEIEFRTSLEVNIQFWSMRGPTLPGMKYTRKVFADMEELGIKPTMSIVKMIGDVFQKLDMMDKYQKLNKKYQPPKWVYRYVKGKRIRIRRTDLYDSDDKNPVSEGDEDANDVSSGSIENPEIEIDEKDEIDHCENQAGNVCSSESVKSIESTVS